MRVWDWEHRQTERVDMLYMLMDIGDEDLSNILSTHKRNKTLSISKIRFFWEEIVLVNQFFQDSLILIIKITGYWRNS